MSKQESYNLLKSSPEAFGIYQQNGFEFYISNTEKYSNAKSFFSRVKQFIDCRNAKSFQELANLSKARYHLILSVSTVNELFKDDENSLKPHNLYSKSFFNLLKWIYWALKWYQSSIYKKFGYEYFMLLERENGVMGEVLKKSGDYFVVFHSNRRDRLFIEGQKILNALRTDN